MYRNFEYDTNAHVATKLAYDPGTYIYNRMQEIYGNRYNKFIDKTAKLAYPDTEAPITEYQRIAFAAGATIVLDALDYSDLPVEKIAYTKNVFLFSNLPSEFKTHEAASIQEQIELSALVGHVSHPELETIKDIVGRYYVEVTQIPTMKAPVNLGVGRMAFVLDKCYETLRVVDPNYDIAQTLAETDWSNIEPEDIIGRNK